MSYENYKSIHAEFCKDQSQFTEAIQSAFNKATSIDHINGINKLFALMLKKETFTADEISCMVELGVNPKIIKDQNDLENICEYFMHGKTKQRTCSLRILLDAGLKLRPRDIHKLVQRKKIIELFIETNTVDMKIVLEEIARYYPLWLGGLEEDVADVIIDQISNAEFTVDQTILSQLFMLTGQLDKMSVDVIDIFVNAGLNLRHDNDIIFVDSCKYSDPVLTLHLINNYPIDLNAHNGQALWNALNKHNEGTIKILLEHGYKVTDDNIKKALSNKDCEAIEMLVNYGGVSYDDVARILVKNIWLLESKRRIPKMLATNGVDFSKIILEQCEDRSSTENVSNEWYS